MALINAIRRVADNNGVYEYIENVNDTDLSATDWAFDPNIDAVFGTDKTYWKFDGTSVVQMTDEEALAVRLNMVPVNAEYMTTTQNAGRFYCYTDNRWVTESDDNYGMNYYQCTESGGTGDNPIPEWEHQGLMMEKGERIKRITINAKTNNNEVTDFQVRLIARYPTNADRWRTGLTGDANMTNDILLDGLFMNPVDVVNWDTAYTGNMNTHHRRTINIDYQIPTDGWLSLYIRPIGTITSTRYLIMTYRYDIIAVNNETSL